MDAESRAITTPLPEDEGKTVSRPSLHTDPPSDQFTALSGRQLILFGVAQLILWAIIPTSWRLRFILPVVAGEFNISISKVQWVAASNMLTWGCFQLIAGRLCDIFGRKRGYMIGCSIYALFNLVSTFMPNLASLNVARAMVGVGAAIGLPASAGLIGSLYRPGRRRTLAYAAISCGGCAGAATGNLLVGLFVGHTRWTWRPCYFSCGLAALVPLFVGWYLVPVDAPIKHDWSVDWLGAASIGVSIFLLLFSLTISNTTTKGWKTPYLPALLVVSALCLALFVWRQRSLHRAPEGAKKPPPIVPKGLLSWKNRNLCVIYLGAFLLWASTDGMYPFISYLYIDVLELDPFQAGLRWSACLFSGVPAAIIVALTISKIPPRILMAVGILLSTMTPLLFAIRKVDWPFWKADLWAFSLAAYGTDGLIAAGSSLISHTASPEDQSVASALLGTAMRLGFAVGLAICTAIQSSFETRELEDGKTVDQATLIGLRAAFWTCVVYMGLAFLTLLFGMKGWECIHDGDDDSQPADEPHHSVGVAPHAGTREKTGGLV